MAKQKMTLRGIAEQYKLYIAERKTCAASLGGTFSVVWETGPLGNREGGVALATFPTFGGAAGFVRKTVKAWECLQRGFDERPEGPPCLERLLEMRARIAAEIRGDVEWLPTELFDVFIGDLNVVATVEFAGVSETPFAVTTLRVHLYPNCGAPAGARGAPLCVSFIHDGHWMPVVEVLESVVRDALKGLSVESSTWRRDAMLALLNEEDLETWQ